jgi:glycosyltransferase involved in cell wall biosynthesis
METALRTPVSEANGIIATMVSRPMVSVITPAYNVAPYIGQCIESVQAQTLSDWEMLIVDDASTDETPAVVQRYLDDPRLRYLRNEQNLGPGDARNRALDAARGEWIAVLDADDWIVPERLERLVAFAQAQGVEMVADLQVYWTEWESVYHVGWATYARPPKRPCKYSVEAIIRAHPAFKPLIRADFLNRHSIRYAAHIRKSQDYAFYLESLIKGARFALLPQPMYYYRVHRDTVTTRYDALVEEHKSLEYLLGLPETTPCQAKWLQRAFRRRKAYILYPQFAASVKRGAWKDAYQLFRCAPRVGWLLITGLPGALYRRLFDREKLIDPWRETIQREVHR